ncbi:hypothetical protein ACRBEV_22990 [Methylobacterium phyllosphaerae]
MRTSAMVQALALHRMRLRQARQEPAQIEGGAVKKAGSLAERMPGAAAQTVVADEEIGAEAYPCTSTRDADAPFKGGRS